MDLVICESINLNTAFTMHSILYGTKYSRVYQEKIVKDSLEKI